MDTEAPQSVQPGALPQARRALQANLDRLPDRRPPRSRAVSTAQQHSTPLASAAMPVGSPRKSLRIFRASLERMTVTLEIEAEVPIQ